MNDHSADSVSLGELVHAMHERGFGLLMMILVLPNCVPIPVPPGTSTVFSIPLLFLSVQMLMGLDAPWLPSWLSRRAIKRETLAKLVTGAAPRLKKIEKLLRPRFSFASSKTGERVLGVFWLLFAISIAVPLPMTNLIPGVGIFVTSLGLLSRDGITIVLGLIIGCFGLLVTTGVVFFGVKVVIKFMPFLQHLGDAPPL